MASMDLVFISVALCVIASSAETDLAANTYNVLDFGAAGNGRSDDSQAFLSAWKSACNDNGANSNIIFPGGGTFLLKPMILNGPCMPSEITILVEGNLVAPNSTTDQGWIGTSYWLIFHAINGLKMEGGGRIGGQGKAWWSRSCFLSPQPPNCLVPPTALSFTACNDLQITGITLVDNPRNHLSIDSCTGVRIYNISITAPETSPNTDGINIGNSQYVYIWDSNIAAGDDCIGVLNGSSNVNISGIYCGPGHGISVGSLGEDRSYAAVEQIHVQHCIFNGTLNGARIKTWQGGSGYARGITFQDMHINNVQFPIIIDQYYCNLSGACDNQSSSVVVSDAEFIGFHGTSSQQVAVKLACSNSFGCTGIVLDDIQLRPSSPGKMNLSSLCVNAHGKQCYSCLPRVTCLI